MDVKEVLKELEAFGDAQTKKTLLNHGAKEPFFGVKVGDLKKILKKTKVNHELSLALYQTGNSDAMYLAGLMADESKITKEQLQDWVEKAYWYYLSEFTVPWIAAESPYALELGLKWIESAKDGISSAGWSTLANYASIKDDKELDISLYSELLERVEKEIHKAPNRTRYAMNSFVINTAMFITSLTKKSQEIGKSIGKVEVELGGTACKVPFSPDYIQKNIDKGRIGKKRKSARC
jgi:hypothetical protein